MGLPDKSSLPLNIFFKGLRKKACEACPFIKSFREMVQKPPFYIDEIL